MGEVQGRLDAYSRSKQNSDAGGMKYQWGRKDSYTFATSSLHNEGGINYYGKYPVKIYNSKSELIYQIDNGGDNTGKTPVGGVVNQSSPANSMMETALKPNVFYGSNSAVISQVGHNKELWDYYWTSYSRGTDGDRRGGKRATWHNAYLDGYIVLRSKSIYDPCPYGYRTPTHGTYNEFNSNPSWINTSYTSGLELLSKETNEISWYSGLGNRYPTSAIFTSCGQYSGFWFASISSETYAYYFKVQYNIDIYAVWMQSHGYSVRCIEDATLRL